MSKRPEPPAASDPPHAPSSSSPPKAEGVKNPERAVVAARRQPAGFRARWDTWLDRVNAWEKRAELYSPTLVAVAMLVFLVLAIRQFGQLADILSPASAIEIYSQTPALSWLDWAISTLAAASAWLVALWLIVLANFAQARQVEINGSRQPDPHAEYRHPFLKLINGNGRIQARFLRQVGFAWLLGLVPIVGCSIWYWAAQGGRWAIDPHTLALVGTWCLLGMVSIAVAQWRLGVSAQAGWLLALTPLTPVVLVVYFLFSYCPWFEAGESPLNHPVQTQPVAAYTFLPRPSQSRAKSQSKLNSGSARPHSKPARLPDHDKGPLVIVCISGGGSRAALFTAGIFNRMWWQPVVHDSITATSQSESDPPDRLYAGLPEFAALHDAPPALPGAPAADQRPAQTNKRAAQTDGQTGQTDGRTNAPAGRKNGPMAQTIGLPAASPTLYPGRLLLLRADVISSVSGGSLAACYLTDSLDRLMRLPAPAATVPPASANSIPRASGPVPSASAGKGLPAAIPPTMQAANARRLALQRFFDPALMPSGLTPRPPIIWQGKPDAPTSLAEFFASPRNVNPFPPDNLERLERFEANSYINAMKQDHLGAAVAGFFTLGGGRGPGIEKFWETRFDWKDRRLASLYTGEQSGRLPALIINSTLTNSGTRLAITNLAPSEFFAGGKFGPDRDQSNLGEATRFNQIKETQKDAKSEAKTLDLSASRYDPLPAQINTLNELAPAWNIALAQAVHASSNFPFGFPLMRFERTGWYDRVSARTLPLRDVLTDPRQEDLLEMTDGGVIDNTGVDSVLALLRANAQQIRARGVLIVQIESSFLQSDAHTDPSQVLHYFTESNQAMWRAKFNADTAAYNMIRAELQDLMQEPNAMEQVKVAINNQPYIVGYQGRRCAFFLLRAGERANENVMTSWRLDRKSRAVLYGEVCAPQQGEAILKAAQWLAQHENAR